MSYYKFDRRIDVLGNNLKIAGVDEAGRGALAGPVVAAAVILPHNKKIRGIRDSKLLNHQMREKKFQEIVKQAVAVAVGIVSPKAIDNLNILRATYNAMKRAIKNLAIKPELILVDGPFKIPGVNIQQIPIVHGDRKSAAIASASIVAKVTRDRIMENYSKKFPEYLFHKNKGYATNEHRIALKQYGYTKIHRRSFNLLNE